MSEADARRLEQAVFRYQAHRATAKRDLVSAIRVAVAAGQTMTEVARICGFSRAWIYKMLKEADANQQVGQPTEAL